MARLAEEEPDLIILDLMMPDMTGIELCEIIRRDKDMLGLPILVASVRSENDDLSLALKSGANDYITKPFSDETLLQRVNNLSQLARVHKEIRQKELDAAEAMEYQKKQVFASIHDSLGAQLTDITVLASRLGENPGTLEIQEQILAKARETARV